MYYLVNELVPYLFSKKPKTYYYVFIVTPNKVTRTIATESIEQALVQTGSKSTIITASHPETRRGITVLAKFETKPTYDMIQKQYPELLL
jgi:hypothetical protein